MSHSNTRNFSLALLASLASTLAIASNWHFAWVGNKEIRYFFDAESIEKTKEAITVWVKTVKTSQADSDGSWATALRWRFNCSKKTIQSLSMSLYDKDGKFLRSSQGSNADEPVVPDSTGEAMLKIVCKPGFPNDKSGNEYFKVEDNDVFRATKTYVDLLGSQIDSAPK
jgi:hypothetical protein